MDSSEQSQCFLVADVGGTNTRIALTSGPALRHETIRRYANAEYDSLADILRDYTQLFTPQITAATIAMAGTIENGSGYLTNRDWHFDTGVLSDITNSNYSFLINDLSAQGYALSKLPDDVFQDVLIGHPRSPEAPVLVVGMGTGFNVAQVHKLDNSNLVLAAESGLAALPTQNNEMSALAAYLYDKGHDFVTIEDALSGRGLEHCYAYVTRSQVCTPLSAAQIALAAGQNDPAAHSTMQLFSTTCGAVLGDLALHFLPLGGITLVGGVARSTLPYLKGPDFLAAFHAKGRLSAFMKRFSINIITEDHSALTGCVTFTEQMLKN